MPRQPLPRGTTRAPTGAPVAPIRDRPRTIQWEGRAIENLGRTLSAIGGDLGDLALRSQKLAIHNEASDAIQADMDTMRQFELDLRAKNENPLQWPDNAEKKMGELSTNQKFKTENARGQYDRKMKDYGSRLSYKLGIAGMEQERRNYADRLDLRIAGYVEVGDLEGVSQELQAGVEAKQISPKDAAAKKEAAEFAYVDKKAMELVRAKGKDEAVKFINQQDKILDAGEQSKLIGEMGTIAKNLKANNKRRSEAGQKKAIADIFNAVKTGDTSVAEGKEAMLAPIFDSKERLALLKVFNGMSDVSSSIKNDWVKDNDLEMIFFDHWAGRDKAEGSDVSISTQLLLARNDDRSVSDKRWSELVARLDMGIAPKDREVLREKFVEIEKQGRRTLPVYAPYTGIIGLYGYMIDRAKTQNEAENIGKARAALLDTYLERNARKKETTPEDFTVIARRLGAQFLGTEEEADELPQPKTQEEYDALPSGARYIHPDLGERVKP